MTFNRIAIYGHRGWASSVIFDKLVASGAPITVLYRHGSDVSSVPASVTKIEIDIQDQKALVDALQNVDILISLVGHEGVTRQHAFVEAIPKTNVQLFVPSDLAARYDELGLRISVNAAKDAVESAARKTGIPMTIVLTGNIAEFALNTLAMGVDYAGNRLILSGNSAENRLNLCTLSYVGTAYASIFASTPIANLRDRVIGLSELSPTGNEISLALGKKHQQAPKVFRHSLESIENEVESCLREASPFALAWYCRRIWATGQQAEMIGKDIWEPKDYTKATLQDLIVEGKLKPYRDIPAEITEVFSKTFKDM
ncbi:hypothetical protein BKA67DRAFT_526909 [Truncatella angustata]|uniref:NmrA-like domain-containing protein n=1 Tax=Truncatella angustata TaxID=152316 RepID=A0A9P8RG03_9PEZI|nr:uncharacterized protein BKA67DRAFT_526909 [Truncatella angustata]KAH6645318.1 hypothetical protein BKA67DRAFT_526909 [Truncatella angustata]KAH8203315.1 hypothetical protein TruAng_002511 [Truncatella angustata]